MLRIALLVLFFVPNLAYSQILVDLNDSVVLIHNDGTCFGTAFVIHEDKTYYYLLSAGHTIDCMKHKKKVKLSCENCFSLGPRIPPLDFSTAKVDIILYNTGKKRKFENVVEVLKYQVTGNEAEDLSLLRVSKKSIETYRSPLHILKLATQKSETQIGKKFWVCGIPEAIWPTTFRGQIVGESLNHAITFAPGVKCGNSGSPMMNAAGTEVIGVVVYSVGFHDKDGNIVDEPILSGSVPFWEVRKFLKTNKNLIKGLKT